MVKITLSGYKLSVCEEETSGHFVICAPTCVVQVRKNKFPTNASITDTQRRHDQISSKQGQLQHKLRCWCKANWSLNERNHALYLGILSCKWCLNPYFLARSPNISRILIGVNYESWFSNNTPRGKLNTMTGSKKTRKASEEDVVKDHKQSKKARKQSSKGRKSKTETKNDAEVSTEHEASTTTDTSSAQSYFVHRCRFIEYMPTAINAIVPQVLPRLDDEPTDAQRDVRVAVSRDNGNIEIWNVSNDWHMVRHML